MSFVYDFDEFVSFLITVLPDTINPSLSPMDIPGWENCKGFQSLSIVWYQNLSFYTINTGTALNVQAFELLNICKKQLYIVNNFSHSMII